MTDSRPPAAETLTPHVAAGLRLFVGPDRLFSREMMAAATGLELRTVKAHCLGESLPSAGALLVYMRLLPVEFASHVLSAGAGLAGVYRIGEEVGPGAALARMTEGSSALAAALADGMIDHVERRTLPAALRRFAAAAEALAAQLEAAQR